MGQLTVTKMLRRLRISAVIALVIYFLSTSLIIADCRRLSGGEGTEDSGSASDEGIPHQYYNSSLKAVPSSAAQVKYRSHLMNHRHCLVSCARDDYNIMIAACWTWILNECVYKTECATRWGRDELTWRHRGMYLCHRHMCVVDLY